MDTNLILFCILCGRDFRPRDADTVICPACGGPPEAPAPSQPQGTVLVDQSKGAVLAEQPKGTVLVEQPKGTVLTDQPHGTVLMGQETHQRMCIICGQDFVTSDPQASLCPQCRGEAPKPQREIISKPEGAQGTVAVSESSLQPASSSTASVPLEWNAGDVILDLYEVKGELGKGGMGVVYRVHHRQWHIDLAVKTPKPEELQKAGGMENFIREAQAWVDLGLHPHIVTCYYVRRLGEVPRVFAECMEGGSLKNWMEDGRLYAGGEREALKRILDVAIQFAWGLGYAHEKGLVHQDVKPGNALMTPDGMLKVTDFGLTGAKGHTPAYAAPEQELGQAVSPRTDIWGWGVSVLEMFTGEVHWGAGSIAASVLENYLEEAPPEGVPPMPAALAELLRQCFQNDPALRPASMDEVAERLMRLYEQETGTPYPRQKPNALELRADSLNNKAVSLLDLGQEDEAVRCWQEALEADPAHLEANFNYGYYRWHKAELLSNEFLAQLQHLEPNHKGNPEYWRLLGWVYLEQGYVEEVEEILAKRGVEDEALRRAHAAPDRPIGREVRHFEGHTDYVNSVAFSPDGRYALSGAGSVNVWGAVTDTTIRLWDVATGREVRRFEGHTEPVYSVAFSPDGRYVLSGAGGSVDVWGAVTDTTIRLWDVATGREVRRFEGHTSSVHSVAFSPDGRYALSGSEDKTLRLWEVATGREVRRFEGHTSSVHSVAFSPDGRYVLSGSGRLIDDNTIRLWEVATGREVRRFEGHTYLVSSVAFSPDGRYVLSGAGSAAGRVTAATPIGKEVTDTMLLWEVASGREVRRYKMREALVTSVAFSPDGRYALSGSIDKTVRLWEVATGREVRRFEGHTEPVYSVAFSPDGRYALSGSRYDTLRLWEVKYPPFRLGAAHPFPALTRARAVEQLTAERGRLTELLREAQAEMERRAFRQAYFLLCQAQELPGCAREEQVLSLLAHLGRTGSGGRVGLRTAWFVRHFEEHNDAISVAFSPDGRYALSGSWDKTLRLWEVATGREVRRFERHTSFVLSVAFSPDGRYILSGSDDKTVRLWEVATGREVRRFWGHTGQVRSVAFSPNGRYALSGAGRLQERDYTVRLWEAASGREVRCFYGHTDNVNSVAVSPDGRYALSGSRDKTVRLWEVATGREVRRFEGHTDDVSSVAVSPDGRYALSGSRDKTVRLWEVATGREVRHFEGHTEWVRSVAFSPDGRYALSGSGDKTLQLWELDWEWEFPAPANWDEGTRPYLDIFLTLHTPYGPDGLSRVGKPQWTEEDFQKLLQELGYRGYGWLRPEGVRRELEKMARERGAI